MTNSTILVRESLLSCLLVLSVCGQIQAGGPGAKFGGALPVDSSVEVEVKKGAHTWAIPAKAGQQLRVRISSPGPVGMHGSIRTHDGKTLRHNGAGFSPSFDLTSEPSPANRPLELRLDFDTSANVTIRVDLVNPAPVAPGARVAKLKARAESLRSELKALEREIAELEKQ